MKRISLALVLTLTTLPTARAHDALATSKARDCAFLIDDHVNNPATKFQNVRNLPAVLVGVSNATVLLRWTSHRAQLDIDAFVGLGGDLNERSARYLIPLTKPRQNPDYFTIVMGSADELAAEIRALTAIHGAHDLMFQVLAHEGPRPKALHLPIPNHVTTSADLEQKFNEVKGQDKRDVNLNGVAVYEPALGDTFFLIPNRIVDKIPSEVLSALGVRRGADRRVLDVSELAVQKPNARVITRLIRFSLISPAAYRALRTFAEQNRPVPGERLSADFIEFLLPFVVDQKAARRDRVADVDPKAPSIVDFLMSESPHVSPDEPGAADQYLNSLWPTDAGPAPKFRVLPNDVKLVRLRISAAAAGRLEKAWALVRAAFLR